MINEYEVAAVVELGKAQDVVLGQKIVDQTLDSLDNSQGTRYIVATDDNE